MQSSTRKRLGRALVASAATLALAVPATSVAAPSYAGAATSQQAARASAAGTIVFIRGYNVWIARGDGSGQYQVTFDGTRTLPYVSPTESDNGLIAAGHGPHIKVMTQNGGLVNRMDPPPLEDSFSHPIDGPVVQAAISPNGQLVSYTFAQRSCPGGIDGCDTPTATAVTRTDRFTPASVYGQTYYYDASWASNTRMLQSGGWNHHAELKDLGKAPVHWFDDRDIVFDPEKQTTLHEFAISPDGRWLVAQRGSGTKEHIQYYSVRGEARSGPAPETPIPWCNTNGQLGFSSPSFSPDSSTMAWQEPDGIWTWTVASAPSKCQNPQLLITNARQPDWSAAPLAPAARVFRVKAKPRITGAAKVGRRLAASMGAWTPMPKTATYRWLRNGRPIAGASGASYKLKKADKGRRISVRVTVGAPHWRSGIATSAPTGKVRR